MTPKPVYVVSGYMRSGTSMMMKALKCGGMKACYNENKNKILDDKYKRSDYHPNPEGFYELGRKEFDDPEFPGMYQDFLIKALHWRLKMFPHFHYRVVFMLRDPKEIEVSYLKMFQRRPPFVLKTYHAFMKRTIDELEKRADMDITPIWHRDMIQDTDNVIRHLIERQFPITDPDAAGASVNPALYRSKEKDLNQVQRTIPGLRVDVPDFLK